MKKNALIIFSQIFLYNISSGQGLKVEDNKSLADLYWKTMPKRSYSYYVLSEDGKDKIHNRLSLGPQTKSIENGRPSSPEEQIEALIYKEMTDRSLRDWGIEFWKRFPNDPRRFDWLLLTYQNEPAYFANPREGAIAEIEYRYVMPLDTIARNKWSKLSKEYLKQALAAKDIDNNKKKLLLSARTEQMLRSQHWRNDTNEKFDIDEYVSDVIKLEELTTGGYSVTRLYTLLTYKTIFGLNTQDIERFIHLLNATGFKDFQAQTLPMKNLIAKEKEPFDFSARAINGKFIDVKQYKGKLLLIDFWSLYCSSCIEKMPEIKTVYEAYQKEGFEVISACLFYNNKYQKDEYDRIMDVHHKTGANWPLILLDGNEGGQGRKIFDTYGWTGVPQLLLLDGNGKLLHYDGELYIPGGLEKLVKRNNKNTVY